MSALGHWRILRLKIRRILTSVTRYWSLESAHANSRLERTLRATEILVRFLMQLGITTVGFWLFISQSRSSDAGLALIYPFFLGIPGIIVILIIFAPIEAAGIKRGARWISLIAKILSLNI